METILQFLASIFLVGLLMLICASYFEMAYVYLFSKKPLSKDRDDV